MTPQDKPKRQRDAKGHFAKSDPAGPSLPKARTKAPAREEAPPPWAQDLAKSIVLGVAEALKQCAPLTTHHSPLTPPAANGHAANVLPPGHSWMTCQVCYDKFTGIKPPPESAMPHLCDDCRIPGVRRKCTSCAKILKRDVPEEATVCLKCAKCILCGTKEHRLICARCIKGGARACDMCTAPAMPGSAMCNECNRQYRGNVVNEKGEAFPENRAPEGYGVPDGVGSYLAPSSAAEITPAGKVFMGGDPQRSPIYLG